MHTPATLTGLAVGDALGMPFETKYSEDPTLLNWDGSFQAGRFKAGQYTDDTQMASALTQSLLANGVYSPVDVAARYRRLFISDTDPIRGPGETTRKAMNNLGMLPWIQSGITNAEGNGTAMRIAPLGLFYYNNIEAAVAFAKLDANITHNSHEARTGSAAVVIAIAGMLQGKLDKSNLIYRVADWLPESRIQTALRTYAAKVDEGVPQRKGRTIENTGPWACYTVPAAFVAFCATDSFQSAVEMAVRSGGDTDTVAAITGALAGTYYGWEQVEPYVLNPREVGLEDGWRLRDMERELFDKAPSVYGQVDLPLRKP